MPRFFVETDDGISRYRDKVGYDVPDLAAAQHIALRYLPEMARNKRPSHGWPWMLIVSIRDEDMQIVYTACLSLTTQQFGQPAMPANAVAPKYALHASG